MEERLRREGGGEGEQNSQRWIEKIGKSETKVREIEKIKKDRNDEK